MAKSNATTATQSAQVTAAATETVVRQFREETHRGHQLTRVGSFIQLGETIPHEVWYCRTDHALLVA